MRGEEAPSNMVSCHTERGAFGKIEDIGCATWPEANTRLACRLASKAFSDVFHWKQTRHRVLLDFLHHSLTVISLSVMERQALQRVVTVTQ